MFLRLSVAAHAALLLLLVGNRGLSAAVLSAYLAYHALTAWGILHPRSRLFGPNLSCIPTRERVVALTFDDGPHPGITPRVLDILQERGARATFFLIGRHAAEYPAIVRRMIAEGHALGSHSQTHSYLFWALPPGRLAREIRAGRRSLECASGRPCRLFRAPVGMKSCFLRRVLEREGLTLVSWGLRFLDSAPANPARLRARLRRRIAAGSILALHDGHDRKPEGNPAVLEALPALLDALQALEYRCVPLEETTRCARSPESGGTPGPALRAP